MTFPLRPVTEPPRLSVAQIPLPKSPENSPILKKTSSLVKFEEPPKIELPKQPEVEDISEKQVSDPVPPVISNGKQEVVVIQEKVQEKPPVEETKKEEPIVDNKPQVIVDKPVVVETPKEPEAKPEPIVVEKFVEKVEKVEKKAPVVEKIPEKSEKVTEVVIEKKIEVLATHSSPVVPPVATAEKRNDYAVRILLATDN